MRVTGLLGGVTFAVPVLAAAFAPVAPVVATLAGYYLDAQAERGDALFTETCAACHSLSEFQGEDFEYRWRRQTAWNLFTFITKTMPEDDPGSLDAEGYADIIAFILERNDYTPGDTPLGTTREALATVPLGPGVDKAGATP